MSNIFEIQQNLLSIFNTIEENDGEVTDELMEELAITQDELKLKIKSYANLTKVLSNDIQVIKEEKDRLTALQKSKERTLDRLKKIIIEAVDSFGDTTKTGGKFIDYGTGKVSVRTSKTLNVEEDNIQLFVRKYFAGLNWFDSQNQLDSSILTSDELIEYANENAKYDDEDFIELTPSDIEKLNIEFTYKSSLADIIKTKEGFDFVKSIIRCNTFDTKTSVNKTDIKNDVKIGKELPSYATLVDSKSVIIK